MMRWMFGSFALVAVGTVGVLACATDEDGDASEPPPTQTIPPAPDAAVVPDAAFDGDGGCSDASGCITTTDCTTVDLCSTTFPVSRSIALNAVWGIAQDDVWAVGTRGTILHGDGATFAPVPSGTTDVVFAVWGTGPNDVWFVDGTSPLHSTGFAGGTATFERVQGASWNPEQASSGRLWAGHSAAADSVWIAGEATARFADSFGNSRSFWRLGVAEDGGATWLPGSACSDQEPCTPLVRALWGSWAVGMKGQTFVLDDADAGHWSYRNPNTSSDLEAIWGTAAGELWTVGGKGTIRHAPPGQAGTWETVESPTTNDLHAIWGSGPNDVWAVGDAGTVIHWNGTAWSLATIGLPTGDVPTRLLGVWGSGPDDVWVVGEGLILHRTAASRRFP
jgi:hypothetical protein